jgi:diguanylate cyclase (GGDEF)-like protein/PAS domain S-box-containing protein
MSPADRAGAHQPLGRAAEATERAATLEDAAPAVVAAVCEAVGWPAGRLLVPPTSVWHLGDPDRFELLRRALDATPAITVEDRRPVWTAEVHPLAHGAGLRGVLGVPVVVGSDVDGVLEFYGEDDGPPDAAAVDLAAGAAALLARVAERARAAAALQHAEQRYRALADSTRDAVVITDGGGSIVSFTRAAEEAFGYWEDEVLGQRLTVLFPARLAEAFEGGLAALCGKRTELTALRRDGSEFPCELSLTSWVTSQGRFFTAVVRDLSDRRQAEREREAFEQQLAQRALHDPLTALPNRALLHDRLQRAAGRAARRGSSVAVLTLDLDRFKSINDTYGHRLGDELLVAVAARLQGILGADDTIARLGGDEFALLRENVADGDAALEFAREVADALAARPFAVQGREESMSATIGVALTPAGASETEQTLRDAVVAMERARQSGRGHIMLYDDSMRTELAERVSVEHDLRLALEESQLQVYYQPIVDLTTDLVTGVEALVRWEHPERGLLSPQQFIGLAEESGLIIPLGRWVLEEACRQGAAWQKSLHAGRGSATEGVRVSVNVSARQFQRPEWTDDVAGALLATGFDPAQLVLEITESVLMEDTDTTSQRLGELKELGVRIAIDDFGTGYSSLGYLRRFPVDILKVDKSFIDGVADGPHESALARAVIKLAATLNLDAVAEGVSNRKQLNTLRRLRCRYAQGFYFSRPRPAHGVAVLLGHNLLLEDGPPGA